MDSLLQYHAALVKQYIHQILAAELATDTFC